MHGGKKGSSHEKTNSGVNKYRGINHKSRRLTTEADGTYHST